MYYKIFYLEGQAAAWLLAQLTRFRARAYGREGFVGVSPSVHRGSLPTRAGKPRL